MDKKTMVKIMNSIPRLLFAAMAFVAAILPAGARQLSVNEAVDAAGLALMQTGALIGLKSAPVCINASPAASTASLTLS